MLNPIALITECLQEEAREKFKDETSKDDEGEEA
jgi:hypothetical protein